MRIEIDTSRCTEMTELNIMKICLNGKEVGSLDFVDGRLMFSGVLDVSAEVFGSVLESYLQEKVALLVPGLIGMSSQQN